MDPERPCEGVFITGTDTGVGKTWVSTALVYMLRDACARVAAMKPVATGCQSTAVGLRNDDALLLQAAATVAADYAQVNPYAFEPPVAPNIAAARRQLAIEPDRIVDSAQQLAKAADCLVVEGVGGWRVPLDDRHRVSDMARWLGYPVILVVGLRLGCINHARLSTEAIVGDGMPFAGWIANAIDPDYAEVQETVESLRREIPVPLLGWAPWGGNGPAQRPTISLRQAVLADLFPSFLRSHRP